MCSVTHGAGLLLASLLIGMPLWAAPVVAQNYPSKPIRFIVPFPPGGGTDTVARVISQRLAERLGQQVVIDNRGGPALNDIVGGQVQLMSGPMISALPFVKAGRLKALAVTTEKRIQGLPDVPAIAETMPGYESSIWHGVLAPAGTPRLIIMRLHDEIVKILTVPEVKERFAREGAEPVGNTPEQFGAFIKSETLKYLKLIKAAGIRAD